jgi:hypothetical protein
MQHIYQIGIGILCIAIGKSSFRSEPWNFIGLKMHVLHLAVHPRQRPDTCSPGQDA